MTKPRKKPLSAVERWRALPAKRQDAVMTALLIASASCRMTERGTHARDKKKWAELSTAYFEARLVLLDAAREMGTPRRRGR